MLYSLSGANGRNVFKAIRRSTAAHLGTMRPQGRSGVSMIGLMLKDTAIYAVPDRTDTLDLDSATI